MVVNDYHENGLHVCYVFFLNILFPLGSKRLTVATSFASLEHESAVESSQLVKEDGIEIITLGISSKVNKEELQMIASSEQQFLLFHDANMPAKLDLISDKITRMICKGKFHAS